MDNEKMKSFINERLEKLVINLDALDGEEYLNLKMEDRKIFITNFYELVKERLARRFLLFSRSNKLDSRFETYVRTNLNHLKNVSVSSEKYENAQLLIDCINHFESNVDSIIPVTPVGIRSRG